MRHLPGSIPPSGSARPRRGLLSVLAAATLLATFGSARSSAEGYSQARGAPSKPSNALAQQSADVQFQASPKASKRAGSRRATRLRATTGCNSKREPFVTFRWIPARLRGRAQRVDYTEFFAGFSGGKFHKSRKLAPGTRRWRTGKIETGFDYDWRVMTRHAHRWVRSAVGSFDGPVCVDNSAARSQTVHAARSSPA
jgi:hypothetical protein